MEDLTAWVNQNLASQRLAPLGGSTESLSGAREVGSLGSDGDLGHASIEKVATSLFAREEARRIETDFKYEGYLAQQERQIERMKRAESRSIPEWFDYRSVSGLSREVVEKLTRVRPLTLGQAGRIPGITPAAVSLVNVYIEIFQRRAATIEVCDRFDRSRE
jgi:tRNA U34 5-carboxymethylaminomethyl modifying enzyme MnmG/GidA